MAVRHDRAVLEQELERRLARGPATAPELCMALGISQPVFSRLVTAKRERWLVAGRGRATRYAARRQVDGVGPRTIVYQIDERGASKELGTLHAILPAGFYLEGHDESVTSRFFDDLPYFMNELRPAGFLGRLVPRRHPELELPNDILLWSADHCLKYITRYGWNLSGSLIVGDDAFQLYLGNVRSPPDRVRDSERARRYPELADDALGAGAPGSSAVGEQPKFLAVRATRSRHVLVKFSPRVRDATSRRVADLLVAEHIALETLRAHGRGAARSEVLLSRGRVFLEVERFDRVGNRGRRGLLSLLALDAEFIGRLRSWSDTASRLYEQKRVDEETLVAVRWLELYNGLIANTDLHAGNLSFFVEGERVLGLAPAYDTSPALYVPRLGGLEVPAFEPPPPLPADGPIWKQVYDAAFDFWSKVGKDRRIGAAFRRIAKKNLGELRSWRAVGERLPRGPSS